MSLVCSAWATEQDVTNSGIDLSGVNRDADVLEDAIGVASDILFTLTGRRWSGGGCTRTVALEPRPWTPPDTVMRRRRLVDVEAARLLLGHTRTVTPLWLPDWPVTAITEVLDRDGAPVDGSLWQLRDGRRLDRVDPDTHRRSKWPCQDFTVTYTHGQPPPRAGVRAAITLAAELALAVCGAASCRLPERVTSITRQGVTLAVLDPMDIIKDGLTGLPDVDLWVVSVNPTKARRRPAVWSPDVDTRDHTYGRPSS